MIVFRAIKVIIRRKGNLDYVYFIFDVLGIFIFGHNG